MVERIRKTIGALRPPTSGPLSLMVRRHRLLFFFAFFGAIAALSVSLSFVIRFEWSWLRKVPKWPEWWRTMLLVAVPVRLVVFTAFGLHRVSWRFAGLRDVPPLINAILVGSAFESSPAFQLTPAVALVALLGTTALVAAGHFAERPPTGGGAPSQREGERFSGEERPA